MPDLLIELFCEEIPARMQRRAAEDLRRLVTDGLVASGCLYEGAKAFATPRRLALHVAGLPAHSPDLREEKRGPRVGSPEAAIQGFLKNSGLTDPAQASIQSDPKKGDHYVVIVEKRGLPTQDIIATILPDVIRRFPWPKSMRWGANSAKAGALRWVRPLHSILATFGPETESPEVVRFEIDGLRATDVTYGHRFMAPAPIFVRRFDDYVTALDRAKVVLDADRRKQIIAADAANLAFARGLELVEDEALLEEVAGLVEWPVVLIGLFDEDFLALPPEVIRLTIRNNQKCFVLKKSQSDALSNRFIIVANIEAKDGGAKIVAGNERVVRARLTDARYFLLTDQRDLPDFVTDTLRGRPLDQRLAKLRALNIVFHARLGTQGERVDRLMALARAIAPLVGADPELAARAAELAKADLVTEMVGEFPEVQGLMGRRYAELQGEPASVAAAIEDHYRPQGPADRVPTDPVAIAVALADKLDVLVGFWAIDEKPTGSKDPFALRRAGLGIIRIIIENQLTAFRLFPILVKMFDEATGRLGVAESGVDLSHDLHRFLIERLKVQLRDNGARHDLVDAVVSADSRAETELDVSQDNIVYLVRRIDALGRFIGTPEGADLLASVRRGDILRIEEKKTGATFGGPVDPALLQEAEEQGLADALEHAQENAAKRVKSGDFDGALAVLAQLRPQIDAFFDEVTVNATDPRLRENRLRLLNRLREATRQVADFSQIVGG